MNLYEPFNLQEKHARRWGIADALFLITIVVVVTAPLWWPR